MNNTNSIPCCPICSNTLSLRVATGRKSGKPFIMLMCSVDGRHFRGFICDRNYVRQVMEQVEAKQSKEKK